MSRYKGLLYLAGLIVAAPWLVYNLAIADTVKLDRELKRAKGEIAQLQGQKRDAPAMIAETASGLDNGELIPFIMDCEVGERCAVVKYTPYITESRDGLAVHTAELVLSGGYADLVRLVERAETGASGSRLVSAAFRSVRQRQRKQTQLHVTLVLQQITKG